MRILLTVVSVVGLSLCGQGCHTKSMRSISPYSNYIGVQLVTTQKFFLTRSGIGDYSLSSGREPWIRDPMLKKLTPTFEEFEKGQWKNKRLSGTEYLSVLEQGTVLEITDVKHSFNYEIGARITWYGRIVSPDKWSSCQPLALFININMSKPESISLLGTNVISSVAVPASPLENPHGAGNR